jgi:hypothetical protein
MATATVFSDYTTTDRKIGAPMIVWVLLNLQREKLTEECKPEPRRSFLPRRCPGRIIKKRSG